MINKMRHSNIRYFDDHIEVLGERIEHSEIVDVETHDDYTRILKVDGKTVYVPKITDDKLQRIQSMKSGQPKNIDYICQDYIDVGGIRYDMKDVGNSSILCFNDKRYLVFNYGGKLIVGYGNELSTYNIPCQ